VQFGARDLHSAVQRLELHADKHGEGRAFVMGINGTAFARVP
jgi:hypothetical protein